MPITKADIVTDPILQCVLQGRMAAGGGNATPCGNVFYYRMTTPGGILNKANFKTIFTTTIVTPLLAAANVRYTPTSVSLRLLSDPTDLATQIAVAGVGGVVTDSEPSNDAVVVRLKTAFRGRNLRGFKHFGGTNESDTTQDILVGGGLAAWQAVAAACFVTLVDAGAVSWVPFLYSPYGSQIKTNPTTVRGSNIVAVTLNKDIRTMRKRKTKPAVT